MDWESDENKQYRVVMKRRGRNKAQDVALWNLVMTRRYQLFKFARSRELKVEHFSKQPGQRVEYEWAWEEGLLSWIDTYRNFACHNLSPRKTLYGLLMWTTVTWTYISQLKMLLRGSKLCTDALSYFREIIICLGKAFGVPDTSRILDYVSNSAAAEKVKKGESCLFVVTF